MGGRLRGFGGASGDEPEGGPEGSLETVGDGGVELGEEVPVAVEGDLDTAVPEAGLDGLRMGALGDGERHGGVTRSCQRSPSIPARCLAGFQ